MRLARVVFLIGAIAAHLAASPAPAGAATPGGYRLGVDFLDAPHESPNLAWFNANLQPPQLDPWYYPIQITDPSSHAVMEGGMFGWSEASARCAVILSVEDAYRAVDTGDPGRTLAVQFYDGAISAAGAGRRLNVILGENVAFDNAFGGLSLTGSAFNGSFANGSEVASILTQNLDRISTLPFTDPVVFNDATDVINNIAGTTVHEIGHVFGLEHVQVGSQEPYAIMSTGSSGLTNAIRLTVRRFETASASLLLQGIGTVAKTDFDMDGATTVGGDGPILLQNFSRTDALFQEGDTNNDHLVNVTADGFTFSQTIAGSQDLLAPGTAEVKFNPNTGELFVSSNGVSVFELRSDEGDFLTANVLNGSALPHWDASDVATESQFNYFGLNPLGAGGILDDVSLGAVLPIGFSNLSSLQLRYLNGSTEVFASISEVPEPTSVVLAGIAAVGLLRLARRSRPRKFDRQKASTTIE